MRRRKVLGIGSALLAAAGTGCLTNLEVPELTADDDRPMRLERVTVENRSSERSLFNINLVRNGEYTYWGQHDVEAGSTIRVGDEWKSEGRTFVAVGLSKQYGNQEVVAMNQRQNVVEHPLEATFVIDERGDVQATPSVIDP